MTTIKKRNAISKDKEIQEDARRLVIARIRAASDDLKICIGSAEYTKKQLLENLEKDSAISQEIIKIQMEFLRDITQGELYQNEFK